MVSPFLLKETPLLFSSNLSWLKSSGSKRSGEYFLLQRKSKRRNPILIPLDTGARSRFFSLVLPTNWPLCLFVYLFYLAWLLMCLCVQLKHHHPCHVLGSRTVTPHGSMVLSTRPQSTSLTGPDLAHRRSLSPEEDLSRYPLHRLTRSLSPSCRPTWPPSSLLQHRLLHHQHQQHLQHR